ncbi:hypothetical protein SE19_00670 [Acidiplasma aeolicum]|jgi:tRNA(Ile2)-agmatinylcytidine synthase|uniref:tRNA(Ile2) 2-agmatinylcytidine synthetase TiaS n=2 Tax=Acidiplasma TaxID=507753 RepID=A0A0Q0VTU3_9ARCH|nr:MULTISPECIES: tRNA(Ile)(2)-agmatinylcytidine synthase [Acidiplasma]KPV47524.1 hypothetical protein SE19_00670 [Acidiplasma aeolicum]KQB34268.1 hypothetical protein AOG54_05325 [Acidiplasma aeolicum]KQB35005.1 hypothetical protein AOG55_08250 [Acidiplasma cupricumulans]
MYIAVDDTDSQNEMCTTYIISQIARKTHYDIIGYPELVRLNPNISHKTRGNGALNINIGTGAGKKIIIGRINGNNIYAYEKLISEPEPEELMNFASGIVEDFYVKNSENTNPGIVISKIRFDSQIYERALQEDISVASIEAFLEKRAAYKKIRTGHGIIGATASLGWNKKRVTYELLDYKYPHYGIMDKSIKMEIAKIPEKYDSTFNNIDYKNDYPAIFPKFKTPVIFGVRGIKPCDLLGIYDEIKNNFEINDEGFIIYETNQGTDDHIIYDPEFLSDLGSYSVSGIISSYPYIIQGGHYFIKMKYRDYEINLAAFEPTKEFRKIVNALIPGDLVRAYGSFDNGTLKLEKIKILKLSREYIKEPPICPDCGIKTRSKGKMDYRCPRCKKRYKNPEIVEIKRNISEGFYEVPVIARRHLSMPLKLAGHFGVV